MKVNLVVDRGIEIVKEVVKEYHSGSVDPVK